MSDWRNRIIEYGEMPANQFLAHPDNARRHPASQREALRGSLDTLGWIAPVLVSRSGHVVDGHARIEEALSRNENAPIPYVMLDLTDDEELQALATFDFITYLATYDKDSLSGLIAQVTADDERVQATLKELGEQQGVIPTDEAADDNYTRTIEPPIYTPKQPVQPPIDTLRDTREYDALISDIQAANLPDEIDSFLRFAATRHIVFDYENIAEYYAHAPAEIQRLFEDSALVIIDINRAIELGYVRMSHTIAEIVGQENA